MLFDAYCRCGKLSRHRRRCVQLGCDWLLVGTPVAAYKLHCGKAQGDRLPELCHVHSYEAYRCKILYRSHLLLILVDRDTELVPVDAFGLAVAQLCGDGALVCYVVLAHLHLLGTQ